MNGNEIICLMGPTASGKTDAALSYAEKHLCEIISVDSALIYQDMNIGTAKPEAEILAAVSHHLINILEPTQSYSAAQFAQDAQALIQDILHRGKQPLLVGGTMLYFHALQNGLAKLPEADPAVREQISAQAEREGWQVIHDQLAAVDPAAAKRINPNDPQRLQRALEVYLTTGVTLSDHWRAQQNQPQDLPYKNIALIPDDRAQLHARIAQRFQQMLDAGFIDEVKSLLAKYELTSEMPSMRAVGYRQAWAYLNGEYDLATMQEKAIAATRQLAKRQLTWLRSWENKMVIDPFTQSIYHIE